MNIVSPTTPVHLFLHPVTEHTDREGRPHELRTDQIVRAVVVEDEGGQLMLELDHRRFLAKTDVSLRPGQELNVRILATNPQLALQILPSPKASGRLEKMLSALGVRIDWSSLTAEIDSLRPQMPATLADTLGPMLQRLQGVLEGGANLKGDQLAQLSRLLGLSTEAEGVMAGRLPSGLKVGLWALLQLGSGAPEKQWAPPVRALLQDLQQIPQEKGGLPQVASRVQQLIGGLQQLQGQLPPSLAQGLERTLPALQQWVRAPEASLANLEKALGVPLSRESVPDVAVPNDLRTALLMVVGRLDSQGTTTRQNEALLADNARQLIRQLESLPQEKVALPKVLPQLRTLLEQIEGLKGQLPAELDVVLEPSLSKLRLALPPEWIRQISNSELDIVFLALGHRAEVPPAFTGSDTARVVLELLLGLLTRTSDQGTAWEAETALQQLEVLQLARGRLSEEGTQMIPLPFSFLEEGYLLVDSLPGEGDENGEGGGHRLRLHLKLRHLGNLQIDALSQSSGLYVRFHAASSVVVQFLEHHRQALETGLSALPLRSLTFAQGAEEPGAELIQRLRNAENAMLDARV